jgi:hypothetical protein
MNKSDKPNPLTALLQNKIVAYALAFATILAFITFVILRQTGTFSLAVYNPYVALIRNGLINTIIVSTVALISSLVIGFVFY